MTITPETIAELRGLLEITSPPPWEWTEDLTALLSGYEGETRVVDTAMAFRAYYQLRVATSDATLIAAAVNALPALLDAAEQLAEVTAERDALRGQLFDAGYREAEMRAELAAFRRACMGDES